MILYHATNGDAVPAILREGLLPGDTAGSGLDAVNLSERADIGEFIFHLFELHEGGFYEFENGHHDVAVTFAVDVSGPALSDVRGCDGDDHRLYVGVIPPEALKIVSVYRGEGCTGCA